jgi:hypothetical protein
MIAEVARSKAAAMRPAYIAIREQDFTLSTVALLPVVLSVVVVVLVVWG